MAQQGRRQAADTALMVLNPSSVAVPPRARVLAAFVVSTVLLVLLLGSGQTATAGAREPMAGTPVIVQADSLPGSRLSWRLDGCPSVGEGIGAGTSVTCIDDGVTGRAVRFDGRRSLIEVPDTAALRLDRSFTMSFWVRAPDLQSHGYPTLLSKGDHGKTGVGYSLWMYSDRNPDEAGRLNFKRNGVTVTSEARVDASWQHFAFTFDQETATWRWFVDGIADVSGRQPRLSHTASSYRPLIVGADRPTWTGRQAINHAAVDLQDVVISEGAVPPRDMPPPGRAAADVLGVAGGDLLHYVPDVDQEADFEAISDLGASWVRIDANWAAIQGVSAKEHYWKDLDDAVELADRHELDVLGVILGIPNWANGGRGMFHPADDPAAAEQFAYELGRRYIPDGVTNWEIGNEPNHAGFWWPAPDAASYVRTYLEPVSRGLRRAAAELGTEVTLLSGGVAPAVSDGRNVAPDDYLREVYRLGGGRYFDHVAHHPYTWPAGPGDGEWMLRVPELASIMAANGHGDRKIWGTEAGWPTGTAPLTVSEGDQADYTVDLLDTWRDWEFTGPIFLHQHRDKSADLSSREDNFGLLRHDRSVKPVYSAVRRWVDQG